MSARKGSGDHRGVKVFWDDFISKASTDSDASQNNGGFFSVSPGGHHLQKQYAGNYTI